MDINKNGPVMECNTETGMCEIPGPAGASIQPVHEKPVRILYFTDPICSSCWGIEPQLRKLKMDYGEHFEIEYRMGGLLKSWESYGGSDVANPTEVAKHWDEASSFYEMPIDGDIWLEDPLPSSYPPSIAFKAAQIQDSSKAEKYLRRIREMVFLEKKNITRWENLVEAAIQTGLEPVQFRKDYYDKALELFDEDLQMARQWGVRGFPSMFFIGRNENAIKVYGSKPYQQYENAILQLVPGARKKQPPASYETVLNRFGSLTAKEFAVLNARKLDESEVIMDYLVEQGQAEKIRSKNGFLWKKI